MYVNGDLKVSRTNLVLNRPVSNIGMYLNNSGGASSQGDFTLYSFKAYTKCLTQEEVVKNMTYEQNRLGLEIGKQ